MKTVIFGSLFCLIVRQASAGDAVAMGFNYDGVWTAVTYSRSTTPKGGPEYHEAAQACAAAVRDLRVRASEGLARTKIIGQSDRTGYVAVARGWKTNNNTVTAIGRGESQMEADQKALDKLNEAEATTDKQIVYRYFSYGIDSATHRHGRHSSQTERKRISTSN